MTFNLPNLSENDLYYGTDTAYRQLVRRITGMNNTKVYVHADTELDEITYDENAYDETATMAFLTLVWNATKQNTDLCELYQTAAGAMFSTDPEIGLVVLFAYNYLPVFYPVLYAFSQNPGLEVDTHPNYDVLMRLFTTKR